MHTSEYQSQVLSLALKGSKSGIWDWHIPKDIVFFDSNYYQMAGYEPNEFPHKFEEWEKRVHPDDIAAAKVSIQQYLTGEKESLTVEFRFKTKAGSWMWILGQGEIIERDINDNPTRMTGLHVDISQFKKTEQALQKERTLSASLIDTAQLIILILDVEGRVSRINHFMEELTGYKEAEVKGKDWFDTFLIPADHTQLRELFKKAVVDIDVSGEINPIVAKDGRELMIEWYSKTLKGADGVIVGLLSFGIDIAERKKAEKALQESETTFRKLFEGSSDAILLIDNSGVFVECNQAALDLLKMSREQLLHLPPSKISPEFQPDGRRSDRAVLEVIAIAYSKGKNRFDWTHVNAEGGEFIVEVSLMPVTIKGQTMLHTTWRDITERKRAEAEKILLESQLQENENIKSIGQLAGGLAHDFNNILAALYGNLSLAKRKMQPDHPGFKFLEAADKSMDRASLLTNQLLTFAKGGAPVKANLNLGKLVDDVVMFNLSGSNVKSIIHQTDNLWLAKADQGQIQQVIGNLTINAKHAMPNGGTLRISFENAVIEKNTVPGLEAGKYVRAIVADEGIGISPENLGQIFNPYFTTRQTGSGLGLTTVHSIVKRHEGQISVTSQLGKGTTFTFYLPASDSKDIVLEPSIANSTMDHQSAKVLIMDDDHDIRETMTLILEELNFSSETVAGGRQAIERYQQTMAVGVPFDLVILDLTIPGEMGGIEVANSILEIDPQANLIVSSGYADSAVMANFSEYGFKGVISKPYNFEKVAAVLSQALDKK